MRNKSHSQIVIAQEVFPPMWRNHLTTLFGLLLSLCLFNSAHAGFVEGSYRVDIAESERLLDAMLQNQRGQMSEEQLADIEMQEMCRNPGIRLIERNRPAILLQNTSNESSDNEISQFTIDLQQLGYEFGTGDFTPNLFNNQLTLLSGLSDPDISISSSYGTVSDLDPSTDPTKLVVDISGLTAGKALIFRFDLDPMPTSEVLYPDFRTAVLGADSMEGSNAPALISATFAAGEGDDRMTTPTAFTEFRGSFDAAINSGILENYGAQSHTEMFFQSSSTEIPEPAAGTLLLMGLGIFAIQRRTR